MSLAWRVQVLALSLIFSTAHAWASENTQNTNTDLVRQAFANWQQGKGSAFDLLAPDAKWTVAGTSPVSAVYASKAELAQAVRPITARLATPIVPTVRSIVAEGDVVAVLWSGTATALDHKPYDNTYLWHMTFKSGQIVEVTAFLDTYALDDLMRRVKPAH
ncbi:nuclear transport factor 2 family protein [Pseudomonas sp. SWRI154]|uniref:nuclear transport factor 2 family protein n=1 Tax=Pseudomonas sp. SWRI154 TaxID=2745501 RepID=UPI0016492E13|nr:nuclear transport factor 2 family protein [Pseudomonas sp. SWRI154]MBC3363706.1 nuclear transport factor 2 family protein [Pseudomonas sp. SWRI154]